MLTNNPGSYLRLFVLAQDVTMKLFACQICATEAVVTLCSWAMWLIRSHASSIVPWGGRTDQWFPALGCTVAAGWRLQQALPGCGSSVCWVLSSGLRYLPHPTPPHHNPPPPPSLSFALSPISPLSCVWSRSVCSLRRVQVNKCTERMWSLICINL